MFSIHEFKLTTVRPFGQRI